MPGVERILHRRFLAGIGAFRPYLGHVRDDWMRLLRRVRGYWGLFVLALFCLVSFLPLGGLASSLGSVDAMSEIAKMWPWEAYTYSVLAAHYEARRSLILAAVVIATLLMIPVGAILYETTRTLVEIAFQLFYSISPRYYRLARKCSAFEHKALQRALNIALGIYLAIFVIVAVSRRSQFLDANAAINLFGVSAVGAVALVFAVAWRARFKVLQSRTTRLPQYYRTYLFSTDSVVRSFKNVVDLLIFFAVLGWFLLPSVLGGVLNLPSRMASRLESGWQYSDRRELLTKNATFMKFLEHAGLWIPPSREELVWHLNPVPPLYDPVAQQLVGLELFMSYGLAVVTFVGMLSVAIPTLCVIHQDAGRRRVAERVTVNTLKTMAVSLFLQMMLAKAYMVDMAALVGFATVFMFLMTFFLTLEAQAHSKIVSDADSTS